MTNPIFFAPEQELIELQPGDYYRLHGDEGRHAAVVRRLGVGESFDLADGTSGIRLTAIVLAVSGEAIDVEITDRKILELDSPALVLVQALSKGDRSEQAIESATEIGVDAVVPWQAARSIVQWRADKALRGVEKWRNVVQAATKQSRRVYLPKVRDLVVTGQDGGLREHIRPVIAAGGMVLVLHEDAEMPLSDIDFTDVVETGNNRELWVIVGPEGGISPEEREDFLAEGALEVRLGKTVLRSSSAGPAALVALLLCLRRW